MQIASVIRQISPRIVSQIVVVGTVMGGLLGVMVGPARAQATRQPSDSVLSIDTYIRYLPLACEFVPVHTEQQYWRDKRSDTLYRPPLGAPLQAVSVAEVRVCLQRHTIETANARQSYGLGGAYLTTADDMRAEAAFQRFLKLGAKKTVDERAWDLFLVVSAYASATPVRIAKVLEYMAKLDDMGTSAAFARLLAHNRLYTLAAVLDSVPFMETEVQAAVKASRELVGDARREWAWQSVDAFINKADLEGRRSDASSAITTLQQAATDLGPLRESIRDRLLGSIYTYALYGKPAVKLASTYTFTPRSLVSASPIDRPTLGKVSLVMFVDKICGEACFPGYAVARRLMQLYETQGLELTLVTRTGGWDRDRLVKPQEESDSLNALFHDYLHIPATLMVWKTEFGRAPDGKLRVRTMPNDQAYFGQGTGARPNSAVLVDRKGIIRHVTSVTPANEQQLRDMISELLRL